MASGAFRGGDSSLVGCCWRVRERGERRTFPPGGAATISVNRRFMSSTESSESSSRTSDRTWRIAPRGDGSLRHLRGNSRTSE